LQATLSVSGDQTHNAIFDAMQLRALTIAMHQTVTAANGDLSW
jgi:hypothetical protein